MVSVKLILAALLSTTLPAAAATAQALPPPGTRVMLTGHLGPNPGPAEPWGFDFRRAAFFEGAE